MKIDLKINKLNIKFASIAVLGILICALFFIFLIAGIVKTAGRCLKISHTLKTLKGDLANIDKIESGFESLRQKGSNEQDKLLSREELPQFLEALSKLAQDSDIKVLSLKPLAEKAKIGGSNILKQFFKLELKGGYHNIGSFFAKLEGSQKFIKINAFKIIKNPITVSEQDVVLYLSIYLMAPK